MAFLIFSQTLGGAIFLTIANTIFANNLATKLVENGLPDDVIPRVLAAGASAAGLRSVVTRDQLPAVLWAYARSIDLVFYLTVASAVGMFALAWGMGWHDIRQTKGKGNGKEKKNENGGNQNRTEPEPQTTTTSAPDTRNNQATQEKGIVTATTGSDAV